MTLQRRFVTYFAGTAIVSCTLTVAVALVLVRHHVVVQRLAALQTQAEVVALAGSARGATQTGVHVYRVSGGRAHRVGPALGRAVARAIPSGDGQGTIRVGRHAIDYAARAGTAGRIVIIRAAGLAFAQWRPFLLSLLISGLGGVLVAGLLAWVLARRLGRPLRTLAHATGRLAAGETPVTVPADGPEELAALGTAFNTMSAELGRARSAQRVFLESVGHELRTPLTSVRGYAEALQEGAVGAHEAGEIITAEAKRLERLVGDLMELARLERLEFPVTRRVVDLAGIASAARERHLPRARELGVTVRDDLDGPARAMCDADRVLQATSNLVENALRLTPAGGAVTIRARPGEITVSDTGPGLDDADLARAFERFYLHDRYRSDPERATGSGLGLAIVAQLVAAMGGTATVSSSPGEGACFSISLPAAPAPPERDLCAR